MPTLLAGKGSASLHGSSKALSHSSPMLSILGPHAHADGARPASALPKRSHTRPWTADSRQAGAQSSTSKSLRHCMSASAPVLPHAVSAHTANNTQTLATSRSAQVQADLRRPVCQDNTCQTEQFQAKAHERTTRGSGGSCSSGSGVVQDGMAPRAAASRQLSPAVASPAVADAKVGAAHLGAGHLGAERIELGQLESHAPLSPAAGQSAAVVEQPDAGPGTAAAWQQFSGVHPERLAAFAGIASHSLRSLLDLAGHAKALLPVACSRAMEVTGTDSAQPPDARPDVQQDRATEGKASGSASTQYANATADILSSCAAQSRQLLRSAQVQEAKPDVGAGAASETDEAATALAAEAVDRLFRAQQEACSLSLTPAGGPKHADNNAAGAPADVSPVHDALAQSGLPSLLPLLLQLQRVTSQLMHSIATGIALRLNPASSNTSTSSPASRFAAVLADAELAADAIQRLWQVLAGQVQMAEMMLTHRPCQDHTSTALLLVRQISSVAQSSVAAVAQSAARLLKSLEALSRSQPPSVGNCARASAETMEAVQQLLAHTHSLGQHLMSSLVTTVSSWNLGTPVATSGFPGRAGTGPLEVAGAAAERLQTLVNVVGQLYPRAARGKVVHAASVLLIVQVGSLRPALAQLSPGSSEGSFVGCRMFSLGCKCNALTTSTSPVNNQCCVTSCYRVMY